MVHWIYSVHLLVILMVVNAEDQCDNNNATHCTCIHVSNYEYHCPPLSMDVLIKSKPNANLSIECLVGINTFNADILPNYISGDIIDLEFKHCPLPDENFKVVLNKFGIQSVQNFHLFDSYLSNSSTGTVSKDIFYGLSDVHELIIEDIKSKLDDDLLFYLSNLTTFHLLTFGTAELNNFLLPSTLKELWIIENRLQEVPRQIFENLTELIMLKLSINDITKIKKNDFSTLKSLKYLDLSSNILHEIEEDGFSGLSKLETLDLSFNRINSLSDSIFAYLKDLETLKLNNNNLSYIDSQLFSYTTNLKYLQLQNNRFTDITSDQSINVKNLVHIQYIDLSFNHIVNIKVSMLVGLHSDKLQKLNLEHNKIEYVYFDNAIHTINANKYNQPRSPVLMDLKNNPLSCNCGNFDLIKYYHDIMIPGVKQRVLFDIEDVQCPESSPYYLDHITDIRPEKFTCRMGLVGCPKECDCSWRPLTDHIIIDCSHRNLTSYPKIPYSKKKIEMNLDGNYLSCGPDSDLGYEVVKYLNLSNNKIRQLKWIPVGIETLALDGNELTHLDQELLQLMAKAVNLTRIDLSNNPWTCDCSARDLLLFIKSYHRKMNPSDVVCKEDKVLLVDKLELCKSYTSIILATVLPILGVMIVIVLTIFLYIYFREEVALLVRVLGIKLNIMSEDGEEKNFDIFLSYSSVDEDFVTQNILPVLEDGPKPFKTCIHIRDWEPGEMITTHVTNSVLNSKRTLVVLSDNFLESSWGLHEFKTAHSQAIKDGIPRVIVVKYGELNEEKLDEDIKTYLTTNTYVEWGKPWFWYKLLAALPHSRRNRSNLKHANMMLKIDDQFKLIPNLNPSESTPPITTLDPAQFKIDFYKTQASGEAPLVVDT